MRRFNAEQRKAVLFNADAVGGHFKAERGERLRTFLADRDQHGRRRVNNFERYFGAQHIHMQALEKTFGHFRGQREHHGITGEPGAHHGKQAPFGRAVAGKRCAAGEVLNFLGELAVEEMPGVFARHTNECSVRCAGNAWRHCQSSGRLFHGLIWGQGRS